MIYRTSEEKVAEYYQSGNMNQSSLKYILEYGMESYLDNTERLLGQEDLQYEEKDWQILGSGVDCILTFGRAIFDKNYYFSTLVRKPGDKVMLILKAVYNTLLEANIDPGLLKDYKELVWNACNFYEYYMNRVKPFNEDTRVGGIVADELNITYWNDLKKAGRRQILSDSQYNVIISVANSILEHQHTKHLLAGGPDIDIIYQCPLYFKYNGIPCKALPDMVIINHKTKRIIPIDFKTMSGYVTKFNKSARKRRYDIQAAFYMEAIERSTSEYSTLIGKDVSAYSLARFAFIVESTTRTGVPLVFPMKEDLLLVGHNGDGEDLLGWKQALAIYDIWNSKGMNLTNIVSENNGVVFLGKDYEYNLDL